MCPSVGQLPSLGSPLLPPCIMLGCPCFSHTISSLVPCQQVLLLHSAHTAFKLQQQSLVYGMLTQEMLPCMGSGCLLSAVWVWDRGQCCVQPCGVWDGCQCCSAHGCAFWDESTGQEPWGGYQLQKLGWYLSERQQC